MTAWSGKWRKTVDKTLGYLSLARKAGLAELGEEPVGAAARALHAHLIVVASDASHHTWRRAKSFAAGTDQQVLRLGFTKDEMGMAIGRTSLAVAALTDPGLALALAQSVQPSPTAVIAVLEEKVRRREQRKKEADAHRRNLRKGKKK